MFASIMIPFHFYNSIHGFAAGSTLFRTFFFAKVDVAVHFEHGI
jgi:hypothetical protein